MVAAMILAGGSGTRVGADRPKQFVEIYNNKPVLAYTVEIYQNNSEVDVIEIVCHSDWMDYVKEMVSKYGFSKVKYIVVGGETFQKSVINGVRNFDSKLSDNDIVMIHYGASPFTTQNIVADSIKVCREYGMAASCTPCYQLMGTNDAENKSIPISKNGPLIINPNAIKSHDIFDAKFTTGTKLLLKFRGTYPLAC